MASGYIAANGKDLDDIFGQRVTAKTHNVQYYVDAVDISNRYEKLEGPPITEPTGFEWHGQDLNEIFGKLTLGVAYRFLDVGRDILATQVVVGNPPVIPTFPFNPVLPPPPYAGLMYSGSNIVYPATLCMQGVESSNAVAWNFTDQVIVPDAIAGTLDDLWAQLDPVAIPDFGAGVIDFSVTVGLTPAATFTLSATCGRPTTSVEDYIESVIAGGFESAYWIAADGTLTVSPDSITDIESFWAVQTAMIKGAGLYSGLNQVAIFPLFTTLANTQNSPETLLNSQTDFCTYMSIVPGDFSYTWNGGVQTTTNLQAAYALTNWPGDPNAYCYFLNLPFPTLLIERILG